MHETEDVAVAHVESVRLGSLESVNAQLTQCQWAGEG